MAAGLLLAGQVVAQSGDSQKGTWVTNQPWPVFGIHVIMLPNRNILIFNRGRYQPYFPAAHYTRFKTAIVAPPYTTATEIPFWDQQEHTPHEIFCSGHVLMPDGKVFFAGGHIADNVGTFDTHTFDPATNTFRLGRDMKERRWYPTCVLMPNGRVAIFSGTFTNQPGMDKRNPFFELWMDGVGPTFSAAHLTDIPSAQKYTDRYYPFVFVDPKDGFLYFTGNGVSADGYGTGQHWPEPNQKLNTLTWTWQNYATQPNSFANVRLDYPSAVMMNGVIYKSGGSKLGDLQDPDHYATKRTIKIDLKAMTPAWTLAAEMVLARKHHTLTALPDGHLIAMGGTLWGQYGQPGGPQTNDFTDNERSAPEWLDTLSSDPMWQLLQKPTPDIGRGYHSAAVLLPDARVLMMGGENEYQITVANQPPITAAKRTTQIFSPPYGGNNNWMVVRPRLMQKAGSASAPPSAEACYNDTVSVVCRPWVGRRIVRASLVSLASVTHGFNQQQTFVWATVVSAGSAVTQVRMPQNENVAPPGHYMLFLVDDAGVPSEAQFIRLTGGEMRAPASFNILSDVAPKASIEALYAGDNIYLGGGGGLSSGTENTIAVEVETVAPPGVFRTVEINSEGRTSVLGTRTRELWNWDTGEWVLVGNAPTTLTDSLACSEITVGTDFEAFTASRSRKVRARVTFTADTPLRLWLDMVEIGFRR